MPEALLTEALLPVRADPTRTAILFDIDGTLAPIVDHAADAHVPEGTRQLLMQVARRYGVVACVSGRRASEARAMVSIGTISYLGSHGAELLRAGWTEARIDPALARWSQPIADFGRAQDSPELRRCRVRIEDKGAIVAFHWRGAPDEAAARGAIDAIAGRAEAEGLTTHWGRKVLEVRPPVRFDKGVGIASFLEGTEVATALYAGDDVTDLDAFRGIREMTGDGRLGRAVLVGVSSEEGPAEIVAEADLVVAGTDGVRELLGGLVAV